MALFVAEHTTLFEGGFRRLLHIAPEPAVRRVWASRAPNVEVITIDLMAPNVSVQTDITRLPFADATFDAIVCSHVLEHIPDEQTALRELRRVLQSDGWALIIVPMRSDGLTYEDAAITTPESRLTAFGQEDHVRMYGTDAALRIERSGFFVRTHRYFDQLSVEARHRYGVAPEPFFMCTQPQLHPATSAAT